MLMGLDMYLSKKTYCKNWSYEKEEEKWKINVSHDGKKVPHIKPERLTYLTEEVGYWRKANHIHKWFVDNIQDGEDDCKTYNVSIEQLQELLDKCYEIRKHCILVITGKTEKIFSVEENKEIEIPVMSMSNKHIAEQLLPTQDGFFFGGTDYDNWYMEDINITIGILEPLMKEAQKYPEMVMRSDYYYQSSW